MSRPGTARILDPTVAQKLLGRGDEVLPQVDAPLKHLHLIASVSSAAKPEEEEVELTDSDTGILSDPEETLAQEERLERRVAVMRARRGLKHEKTLKQVFKLLDCLIGQYKLNRTDSILQEVAEACHALGGDWKVK